MRRRETAASSGGRRARAADRADRVARHEAVEEAAAARQAAHLHMHAVGMLRAAPAPGPAAVQARNARRRPAPSAPRSGRAGSPPQCLVRTWCQPRPQHHRVGTWHAAGHAQCEGVAAHRRQGCCAQCRDRDGEQLRGRKRGGAAAECVKKFAAVHGKEAALGLVVPTWRGMCLCGRTATPDASDPNHEDSSARTHAHLGNGLRCRGQRPGSRVHRLPGAGGTANSRHGPGATCRQHGSSARSNCQPTGRSRCDRVALKPAGQGLVTYRLPAALNRATAALRSESSSQGAGQAFSSALSRCSARGSSPFIR